MTTTASPELPSDVVPGDLKHTAGGFPSEPDAIDAYYAARKALSARLEAAGAEELAYTPLTFYRTDSFGWVLTTLKISNGKRGREDRYYAVGVRDGNVYRVGNGPHVKATAIAYLRPDNADRLWKYVELWLKGAAAAGGIRDRISSRRAQGQAERAAGRMSWRWNA